MANVQIRKRQWVALLLAAAMLLELLPFAALKTYADEPDDVVETTDAEETTDAAQLDAEKVYFVDESGTETSIAEWMQKKAPGEEPEIVTEFPDAELTTWGNEQTITWYVAKSSVTWESGSRVTVQGDVRVILQNGASDQPIVCQIGGVEVKENSSLTIYGVETKAGGVAGKLEINGGISVGQSGTFAVYGGCVALNTESVDGINNQGGTVTIGGGTVNVTTSSAACFKGAVTITGGTVTAQASSGSCFEGGESATTITGGTVTLTNTSGSDFVGTTTITGGTVDTATLPDTVTVDGNALITLSGGIGEMNTSNWNGLVRTDNEVTVYGNVTLNQDTELPDDTTLYIPEGSTLTLEDGVALTLTDLNNKGTITLKEKATLVPAGGTGAETVDTEENTFTNMGNVQSATEQTPTNSTLPTQTGSMGYTPQAAPASDDDGTLLLLLVGGGIVVGTAVYYRVKAQRKAAAEAQLAAAAAEETAVDTVAVTAQAAEAAETMPETTEATATPEATETAAPDMAA